MLGYCTDGTNSTKYPDMYISYREFDDLNEDAELDEIEYDYGEQSKGNLFPEKFYVVLRDNELVFMEDEYYFNIYIVESSFYLRILIEEELMFQQSLCIIEIKLKLQKE